MSTRGVSMIRALTLVVAVALVPWWPASASELPAELGETHGLPFAEVSSIPMPTGTSDPTRTLAVWPAGNRGYMLGGNKGAVGGFTTLVAVDLESGKDVNRVKLDPPAPEGTYADLGMPTLMTLDPQDGTLFVASSLPSVATGLISSGAPAAVVAAAAGNALTTGARAAAGRLCPMPAVQCFGGIHVLDPETLEPLRHLPVRTVQADGGAAAAHLRAMSYSPARVQGDADKLHLVVEEAILAPTGLGEPNQPRQLVANVVYAIQMDVQTGRQDWTMRLDACRGTREPREASQTVVSRGRPNPAVIFRTLDSGEDAAVFVGCHGGNQTGAIIRIPLDENSGASTLPVAVKAPTTADLEPGNDHAASMSAPVTQGAASTVFYGPEKVVEFHADPLSQRILMRVIANEAEVWWVYDGTLNSVVGTLGIGRYTVNDTRSGVDQVTGRLYVLGPEKRGTNGNAPFAGGLFVSDIRRSPLAQPLQFPAFARYSDFTPVPIAVGSAVADALPRLYLRQGGSTPTHWAVIEDALPGVESVADADNSGRSLDLDEIEGVTSRVYDGAARGYGARALVLAGVEGAQRIGPADPLGTAKFGLGTVRFQMRPGNTLGPVGPAPRQLEDDACTDIDREVILAFVGPDGAAVVDGTGARGSAKPVIADERTRADSDAPVSRCSSSDWDSIWESALFGTAPVKEPSVPWMFGDGIAACVSGGQESASLGDAVAGNAFAEVDCSEQEASGVSYTRGSQVEKATVAEAISSFRIYLDRGRGVVSRVESVARGIDIDGVLRIDTVRASAESWANGRRQPVPMAEREEGYNPNCDYERTAGTCFQRHIFGVRTPAYSCGPCGDEKALTEGLSRSFGAYGNVRLRDPDPVLAKGAENGFIAAIQKPDTERFADLVLNNDLLQTMIPALEIVRYAPAQRLDNGGAPGRQLYQFAGVEVSSSYGIACLLVYDEATNTCAAPAEAPGSITVSLSDPDGEPLAGGAFEVRQDVDADGVLGLKDTLLPDGACVTAEDGVGTCTFEGLQPGTYLVSQVAAPPGYAKSAEPWASEVASGERRTVAFTNVSNVSTIDMTVTDESGAPLSGASFAAYPDPDADGKVAPDAEPAATCTTDAQGVCSMQVPAGSYVLVQTSAPGGLGGIEPVAFTFASGGQVAAVTVVNYPPSQPAAPEGAASPEVIYTPPVDSAPPMESVSDFVPAEPVDTSVAPSVSLPEQIGGTVVQVIRAPGDALRLLARDPKQAVAWTAALALFALAAMAVRRRQAAIALIQR